MEHLLIGRVRPMEWTSRLNIIGIAPKRQRPEFYFAGSACHIWASLRRYRTSKEPLPDRTALPDRLLQNIVTATKMAWPTWLKPTPRQPSSSRNHCTLSLPFSPPTTLPSSIIYFLPQTPEFETTGSYHPDRPKCPILAIDSLTRPRCREQA